MNLKITSEFRKGILFIRLKGKFLAKDTMKFKKQVIDKIEKNGIRSVVFYVYEICNRNKGQVLICELYESPVLKRMQKSRIFKYIHLIKNELEAFEVIKI